LRLQTNELVQEAKTYTYSGECVIRENTLVVVLAGSSSSRQIRPRTHVHVYAYLSLHHIQEPSFYLVAATTKVLV